MKLKARCPVCLALVEVDSEKENQVHCEICETTFLPQDYLVHSDDETMDDSSFEELHAMARCPDCYTLCEKGFDDENQIHCARCGKSFRPKAIMMYSQKAMRDLRDRDAFRKYESKGWSSYQTHMKLVKCPKCNALCEDKKHYNHELYCAVCGTTFPPTKDLILFMDRESYEYLRKNATSMHNRAGWIAYKVDD